MPRLVTQILLAVVCTWILVEASANQAGDECNDQTSLLQLSSRAHSAPVDVEGDPAWWPLVGISGKVEVVTPTKNWHACGDTIPVKGSTKPLPARGIETCCNGPAYMFDPDNAHLLVKRYLRFGGRFIDTAPSYGLTQRAVGPAMRASGVPRAEVWLQSKLETSSFLPSKGSAHNWVHHSMGKMLDQLGVSYMDSVILHTGPGEVAWEATGDQYKLTPEDFVAIWRGLMDAKQKGKVHNIGVCETTKAEIEHLIKETGEVPAIAMVWWHPWMPKDQDVFIDWLKSKEIAVQVYGMFNTIRHDPVMMMRTTDAALRHGTNVTWGQLVIKMALDMGVSFLTSYHGGYWQEDLKCFGFQPDAKDREILAVTPRWTCSHGIQEGQILSGCGALSTKLALKLKNKHVGGDSTILTPKLVKLQETQSKLTAAQKFLANLAKKTADKEEALLKAHLKGEVKLGHKGLIDAEAKALKLSEEATVKQEAFDRDVDALGPAALTKSLRLTDMVMAQKTFAESERKFAKVVKEIEKKDKTYSRTRQDSKLRSLVTDHRHLTEVAHRASIFSEEAIIKQKFYVNSKTNKDLAQKAVYKKYAKLTPLERLEKDLKVAKQKEAANRKRLAEAEVKQKGIDHKAAKLQKKAGWIKTHANKEAQKIVEQVMVKATNKANATIAAVKPETNKKESEKKAKAPATLETVQSVELCPPYAPACGNVAQPGALVGDACSISCAFIGTIGQVWCPTGADHSGAANTPWGWCAQNEAQKAEALRAKAEKKKPDEIERYCHKEWQALAQLMQRDPWATICLSGDPKYTKCRQHSVHCKDYSPLHL